MKTITINTETELETLKDKMECNGYAYFDNNEFLEKTDNPCYIPENAESMEDVYSYQRLLKVVTEWCNDNPDYMNEHETSIESVLINLWECIDWEFPETFLAGIDN